MSLAPSLKSRLRRLEAQIEEAAGAKLTIAERIRRAEARTQEERAAFHAESLQFARRTLASPETASALEARLARAIMRLEARA